LPLALLQPRLVLLALHVHHEAQAAGSKGSNDRKTSPGDRTLPFGGICGSGEVTNGGLLCPATAAAQQALQGAGHLTSWLQEFSSFT